MNIDLDKFINNLPTEQMTSDEIDSEVEKYYVSQIKYDPFHVTSLLLQFVEKLCNHCPRKKNAVNCEICYLSFLPEEIRRWECDSHGRNLVKKANYGDMIPFIVEFEVYDGKEGS